MRCPNCQSENPEHASFCIECGAAFERHCLKCGFENPPRAKFCSRCGSSFTEAAIAADGEASRPDLRTNDEASSVRGGHDGERRHLTVLFCDLVGSTAIAARLDPEEWREALAGFHRVAAEAITRFEGHVAKYLGDGVMAYFGWPAAHDNDAERAALAGLSIVDAVAKLNEHPGHAKLATRVGIDSGTVVIGRGAGNEAEVFGDPPNIAARVQEAAAPGTVAISDATHRLVAGLFVVEDLGAQHLKGIEQPLQLFRIIRPSGVRGRFQAATAAGGLTPFVGREDELRSLMSRWERVLDGDGQVALITGEAGIGKSRLVQRFHEQIAGTPHLWIEAGAEALYQSTPFYPVNEMLRQALFAGGSGSSDAIAQLAGALSHAGLDPAAAVPLLAPLFNLELPSEYPPSPLPPEQQRRRLLTTLVEWVLGSTHMQPLVIVIEDLHWADPSTLELIQLLGEQGATAKLLLLYTARPEFRGAGTVRSHHRQLMLDRLSRLQAHEMIENIAAHKELSAETIETVLRRATGVPLFLEELTRNLLERGEHHARDQIPSTLYDSLIARLDRLGTARELTQIGAVIGREFSYELLRLVADISERELEAALNSLVGAELLYVRGIPPRAIYSFKHALVQDAAYSMLLKSRRRELHQRIAHTLEERFPDTAKSSSVVLAHHYTAANQITQALPYLRKAAREAIARAANTEAIAHLRQGLSLVDTLPHTVELLTEELKLQLLLTQPLIAIKGYTDAGVEDASRRALALARQASHTGRLFAALGALFSVHFNRGEYRAASVLGREMLLLAETASDKRLLVWAHYLIGINSHGEGDPQSARWHLEQSGALYEPERSKSYGFVQDPGATGLGLLGHVLHSLGYPDQALECAKKALAMARGLSYPYTLAWVLGSVNGLLLRRGDYGEAKVLSEESFVFCTQNEFLSLLSEATIHHGLALLHSGRSEEGITEMRQGLSSEYRRTASAVQFLERYLFAEALAKIGRSRESLAIISDLLLTLGRSSEKSNLKSELCRLKGDLLLMEDPPHEAEAEDLYYVAIEVGRGNGDKTSELQASTSLARLLAKLGRRDEARTMLADIYDWFTEGFDTADLKDAKVLLDELKT